MLSTAIEKRFTIPGYESHAIKTNVMNQWLVQFYNSDDELDNSQTIVIYAKWGTDKNGFTTGLITQSVPFTKGM